MFLFDVNVTLTEAGLAAGPGLGLAPAGLLFEFLAMLRKAGPQKCALSMVDPASRDSAAATSVSSCQCCRVSYQYKGAALVHFNGGS